MSLDVGIHGYSVLHVRAGSCTSPGGDGRPLQAVSVVNVLEVLEPRPRALQAGVDPQARDAITPEGSGSLPGRFRGTVRGERGLGRCGWTGHDENDRPAAPPAHWPWGQSSLRHVRRTAVIAVSARPRRAPLAPAGRAGGGFATGPRRRTSSPAWRSRSRRCAVRAADGRSDRFGAGRHRSPSRSSS
jgi:hypothetical protein